LAGLPARCAGGTSPRTGRWPVRGGTDGDGMTDMTAPRFFTERDADAGALAGHRVAIIGYGTLGRSAALNLRDSGVDVVVGNIADEYRERAVADGFAPAGLGDAAAEGALGGVLPPAGAVPA